ncbi:polysaccharide deacetylase family protein [Candidatus Methylocalor cossyra]|uniref:Polysaccharide deacetylase n=1 Tax=Candidatus Methylocalor cossyra TaxID=3108543 RepID=A0ABM9NLH4_9GAMM
MSHPSPLPSPNPAPPISILMYHQVGNFPAPASHRACYCRQSRFRAQMAWLRYAGFRVISLRQAYAALFGAGTVPARSVVLSFDDGYASFADNAYPILREFGYPAVVFAVSGLLGQPARFLADGGVRAPLMSAATLRELASDQIEIGSHTVNHRRLTRLPPEARRAEIGDSKKALEDLLGRAVDFFCYPSGDYDAIVRDEVAAAGYQAALTCSRGAANTAPNAFEIPRKAISWGDNLAGFFWKLLVKNRRKDRYG